ncbi:MAG: hypothetical protein U1E82_02785 [Nitrosomonas sp.]|nr:TonB-dependent receptor [Nitrosomonas sp.]
MGFKESAAEVDGFAKVSNSQWVLRGEGQLERFSRDNAGFDPHRIDTLSAPVSISYFGSQGLFTSVIGTYVNQKIDREFASPIYEGSKRDNVGRDGFFLLDAVLGFRLPKRRGALSVEVRNLFDHEFLYRNASLSSIVINDITINPNVTNRFIPDRTIMMRLTLHF